MKKIIPSILLILLLLTANQLFAQLRFGVTVGLNLTNFAACSQISDPVKSFLFGGTVEYGLTRKFGLESGVLISGKGAQQDLVLADFGQSFTEHTDVRLTYLEFPINAVLKFNLKRAKFRVFGGPYIGIGVSGKYKMENPPFTVTGPTLYTYGTRDIKFGTNDGNDMKRTDFGLNIGTGLECHKFLLKVQFGTSLIDLAPNIENNAFQTIPMSIKNNVVGFSIGYLF